MAIFFSPRGITLPRNNSTQTWPAYFQDTSIYRISIQNISIYDEIMSRNWKLLKSKGHNSAENYSSGPKFELDMCILKTHLYTEFQFKIGICNGNNEQKLQIIGIFPSPRGITLLKIIQPDIHSNSTCIFSWHIYIPNFNLFSIKITVKEGHLVINLSFIWRALMKSLYL